jgi:hypothetical protein
MQAGRRKAVAQQGELPVFGPEVVAPLADAVGLVDRKPLHAHLREQVEQAGVHEPLRSREEQPQFPRGEPVADLQAFVLRQAGVDRGGRVADRLERIDLVFHQGDQRRDDHVGRFAHQRRQLIAEAFSPAGRHDDERIAAVERRVDRLGLQRPQLIEAPPLREHLRDPRIGVHALARRRCLPWH